MPRPGPRPYECVRRAWHSDRHKPMRGSLIQEIFRVVNEIHTPATKKNKEWQEKLPIVVLKAEEIMYSKANSETEYMDLRTLWDRTNDAISTIIRRDESAETGDLLQPCIEAALALGCIPRRASRSQRHNTPKYLGPHTQEVAVASNLPPKDVAQTAGCIGSNSLLALCPANPISNSSQQFMPYCSTLVTPSSVSASIWGLEPYPRHQIASPAGPCHEPGSSLSQTFLHYVPGNYPGSVELNPSSTKCRSYPLYYGQPQIFDASPASQRKAAATTLGKLIQHSNALGSSNKTIHPPINHMHYPQKRKVACFDLSLRLGPVSSPGSSKKKQRTCEAEDMVSVSASADCDLSLNGARTRADWFKFL